MMSLDIAFNKFAESPRTQATVFLNLSLACMQGIKIYKEIQSGKAIDLSQASKRVAIPVFGAMTSLFLEPRVFSKKPNSYLDIAKIGFVFVGPIASSLYSISNIWDISKFTGRSL